MTTFNEGRHAAEFVLREAQGTRSRDKITVLSGVGNFVAGTVLGRVERAGAVAAADGGNTGNGALSMDGTTPVKPEAVVGVYTATCIAAATDAGTFRVENPDGDVIGDVEVGATFDDDVKFSIADGATDFVVGDKFTITVSAGSLKYTPAPDTDQADGSHVPVAIALYGGDATSGDVEVAAIVRDAVVNGNLLTYDSTVDDTAKKAAKAALLANAGVIVR